MTFTQDLKLFYAGLLHSVCGPMSRCFVPISSVPSFEKNLSIVAMVY